MNLILKVMLVLIAFCITASIAVPTRTTATEKPGSKLVLQVAAVLHASGPTLAFSITNTSNTDIEGFEISQDPQRITVVMPNSKERQYFFSAGPRPSGVPTPVIKPQQTLINKLDASELFGKLRIKEAGTFRLYWQRLEQETLYKSNEIVILREEKTPVFNPTTGRTEPPA